ncbi:MAG TPA: tRNA pseudouridine(38-40) synthase TruA [Candidatus Hydrogenedentes bacterium]|nr:tRNA pseudouridine(38-40) synthase TruA [Candidatus Hydrogenedentota bacterium]HPG67157.1 tRNA pseudouridine(38-40) synthase TruA [Candidatus Hydrogenedentota bacterium]
MSITIKGRLRYDGTGFAGWQVQPDRRTVQGELERVLSQIASEPVRVYGASRTDAGVHAFGQVISFAWPGRQTPDELRQSLCMMLRPEIRIETLEPAPAEFHARFSARAKRYAYTIATTRFADPFSARYAWRVPWRLDLDRLAALAARIEGEHDFAGFGSTSDNATGTVRTLYAIRVCPGGIIGPVDALDLVHLEFHGNAFLYKMVRNITGTLVDIVRGTVPESRLDELLASPGPYHGHTAPARGLVLVEVTY